MTALGKLRNSRSRRWERWRIATVVEATADGLRTGCPRESGRWAVQGAARWIEGTPPPSEDESGPVPNALSAVHRRSTTLQVGRR